MDTIELRDLIRPLLKWWWLILATTGVALISCSFYVQSQPQIYQAQTTIMVGSGLLQNPNPNNTQLGLTEQLAKAYADMANRAPLRHATAAALGLERLPSYSVNVVNETPLIEIRVTDQNPQLAQAVANELVNQLILQSPVGQEELERQQFIDEQLSKLEQSITETEEEIQLKQQELRSLYSAREIADTQSLINALQNKLTSLRNSYSSLLASSLRDAVNQITVLEPAALPRQPLPSSLLTYLFVAVAVGVVLGSSGAYLLEFLDDTVRTEAEVRAQVSLPVLATIPKVNGEEKLVMLNAQASAAAEAYRGLRSSVQHLSSDSDPYVLLMTGPVPHEGKSITAANLAIAFALAGQRVILVDADMHRPVQHRLFRLPNTAGLSTALVDWDFDVDSVLQVTNVPNLRLLASGPLPPSPAELLSSDRMQALIAELQSFADIIILDSPPVTAVADATVLSTYAHGVILVLRANKSRRNKAKRAVETLRQVDAPLLGAILNDVAKHSSAYSHSDYGYRFNTGAPGSSTASNVPPNVPPDSAHRRQNGAPQPRRARRTSIIPRSRRLTSSGETERLHREP